MIEAGAAGQVRRAIVDHEHFADLASGADQKFRRPLTSSTWGKTVVIFPRRSVARSIWKQGVKVPWYPGDYEYGHWSGDLYPYAVASWQQHDRGYRFAADGVKVLMVIPRRRSRPRRQELTGFEQRTMMIGKR